MADVIDFSKYKEDSGELLCAKTLLAAMDHITTNGPMAGAQGVMLAWVNKAGQVEYRYSANLAEDGVLAMLGPIQLDCSQKLLAEVVDPDACA